VPRTKRKPPEAAQPWEQLRLHFIYADQEAYESIRPMLLEGQPALERAKETGISKSTLNRRTKRFRQSGMAGLVSKVPAPQQTAPRPLPAHIRWLITELKAEYAALTLREIAAIIYVKNGRRPSHHTVQKVLTEAQDTANGVAKDTAPIPPTVKRRFPPYAQILGSDNRRMAIVRLHLEGWPITRIAGYLQTTRLTVRRTIERWIDEGVRGLEDKATGPKGPRKVTLQTIAAARKLQVNPRLGAFRLAAALEQQGIRVSPRTCSRILQLNRDLYPELAPPAPEHPDRPHKPMPYATTVPHAIWTVDVRYISEHQCADFSGTAYVLTILDNASRAALASLISPTQDLGAYLQVLYAAIYAFGAPDMLVSDGGAIFKAKQAQAIYQALEIQKEQIEKPWQSYIETMFSVQRRMADFHFERATSWKELSAAHGRWFADYNYQRHFAHEGRTDGRHSPQAVLNGACGRIYVLDAIQPLFPLRYRRLLDRYGCVQFQHWKIYGEEGLAGKAAAVWLYKEVLTVAFREQPLAHYGVVYQAASSSRIHELREPHFYATPFGSAQLRLWDAEAVEWHPVRYRPPTPRHQRSTTARSAAQLVLWAAL
jgi:transposase